MTTTAAGLLGRLICLIALLCSGASGLGQAPLFTNAFLRSDGLLQIQLRTEVGQSYTFETSTNLPEWKRAGTIRNVETNLLTLVDSEPAHLGLARLFYRVRVGVEISFELSFHQFAQAGQFQGGYTAVVGFPVAVNGYTANFFVANDPAGYPLPGNVSFTGPAGSGLSGTPADPNNSWTSSDHEAAFQSPVISNPKAAPGGLWTVRYKGTNQTFNLPDSQAGSRLVIPVPTVAVANDLLQSVSWVYRDATTGATLPTPPSYLTELQIQLNPVTGGTLYNSEPLPPKATRETLTSPVRWSSVAVIAMAYGDSLGNQYVVFFQK